MARATQEQSPKPEKNIESALKFLHLRAAIIRAATEANIYPGAILQVIDEKIEENVATGTAKILIDAQNSQIDNDDVIEDDNKPRQFIFPSRNNE